MEHLGTEAMKQAYAESLIENNDLTRAIDIYTKDVKEPIFEGLSFHPESEPILNDLNQAITEIAIDIKGLDSEIKSGAENYSALMLNINTRLNAIDEILTIEANRIRDINVICGNYNDFATVKAVSRDMCSGTFGYLGNSFFADISDAYIYTMTIVNVTGNGYEGNDYVLTDNNLSLLKSTIDTSNRDNIVDNNDLTYYEYSRLTTTGSTAGLPVVVNKDNEDARCTITLYNEQPINMIKILSDADVIVEDVRYSIDNGITYQSAMDSEIEINNPDKKYSDPNYVYETGLIAFPSTSYLRLQLRSSGATDDKIGRINSSGTISQMNDVSRHLIRISGIQAMSGTYNKGVIEVRDLVSSPVDSIAIFANEYIPDNFPDTMKYIQYILTVNGQDYEVVPMNSEQIGTKIIRFADYSISDSYITHINESIKEASLRIIINTPDGKSTPILANLKICYGKAVQK